MTTNAAYIVSTQAIPRTQSGFNLKVCLDHQLNNRDGEHGIRNTKSGHAHPDFTQRCFATFRRQRLVSVRQA
jgi:hypothetical protein